jgi:hypothetical protein
MLNKQMDFTLGTKICIPYVKDFAVILNKISTMPIESGIIYLTRQEQ